MTGTRNYSIDTLKFVCAVLVVLIHVPGMGREEYRPVTRLAVPCFFMISGYLLYQAEGMEERLKRSLRNVAWILLWSTALYALIEAVRACQTGNWELFTWKRLFAFAVFNYNQFGHHLWYLAAYLYVLMIAVLLGRRKLWRACFAAIPLLLLANLAIGKYSQVLWGRDWPTHCSRNFLLTGLPYFAIGCLIKKYRERLSGFSLKLTIGGYFNSIYVFRGALVAEKYWL